VIASLEVNMAEMKDGCVKPARGPLAPESEGPAPAAGAESMQEVPKMLARVGKEAVDFEANAFVAGVGFKPVKLSDYKGQWIVLCFYPGDFTFV
jgi:peroxiredoxin (alkyl hydroperoxide reductase subunit C)